MFMRLLTALARGASAVGKSLPRIDEIDLENEHVIFRKF